MEVKSLKLDSITMYIDRFPGVQTMLKWTGYGGCQAI